MANLSKVSLEADEIIGFLKKEIQYKEACQKILEQKIINRASQERGLTITPEEIQAEADIVRREKRLEKASDTLAWLADQVITPEDWELGIRDRLLAQKLSEHLLTKDVEKFFAQNRLDFEQVLVYQIILASEKLAQELFYQIEDKEISFYEAAHFYDIDEKRRQQCGCEGKLYRWSLKPDIAAVVFSAQLGEVVGPLQTEQGYHLLMVQEFIPAELTSERYQEILKNMFNQWLASELNYMIHNETS